MRTVTWNRTAFVESLRGELWRHLSQASIRDDDFVFEASRLLQMSASDVRTLAQLHFVLSDEVASLLEQMPSLIRRLSTTTEYEREASAERVRGAIAWGETLSARAASGLPHLFVTNPARRAYETPENLLLVFALSAIARFGRLTGWQEATSRGTGEQVRSRVNDAVRWGRARGLADLEVRVPTPTVVARARAGRRRRLYGTTLAVVDLYQQLIARLSHDALRS